MELNLALSIPCNRNCSNSGQPDRSLVEGFDPAVQLRETRSSFFLDINLPGLRKEDIWLQMDNTRTLIIRGQRYLHNTGMVGWTWHLVQRANSRRRPFRIPNDVNVAAVSASFHHGVLHVVMPKFRWNRFSPYQVNSLSSQDRHHELQLYPPLGPPTLQPHRPQYTEDEAGQSRERVPIVCEADDVEKLKEVHMEMESFKPAQPQESEISVVIPVEEQWIPMEVPPEDCPSSEQELVEDLIRKKEAVALCVSPSQNPQEKQPDDPMEVKDRDEMSEAPGSDSEEESVKEIEAQEAVTASPSDTTTVSNGHEGGGTTVPHEEEEKGKAETMSFVDEQAKSERVQDSQPVSRKGLSHFFSSIAEIAARKFRRG